MANQPHYHPHPVVVSVSILRLSVFARLAVAGCVIVAVWAAVFWAMA